MLLKKYAVFILTVSGFTAILILSTCASAGAISLASPTASVYLPSILKQPSPTPLPTATMTPTPIPGPFSGAITTFSLGKPGGSDVIPHQIVRTSDDRLYIFGYQGDQSKTLMGYWTTSPGLPTSASVFAGSISPLTYPANIISVDVVYDGSSTIHVITNSADGNLMDRPFSIVNNTFTTAQILAKNAATPGPGMYVGTSGVSAGMDGTGILHVAYWSSGNHITYLAYNPSSGGYSPVSGPTVLDSSGSASHPSLAVSPVDNSVTVAWVSQATNPAQILARTKTSGGAWGGIKTVNAAPVWTSTDNGINIDQGPSLIIDGSGVRHLTYIENFTAPNVYGRIRYAVSSGSGWSDTNTGFYSHDPGLALSTTGGLYIVGHGYDNQDPAPCNSMQIMCVIKKNANGSWGPPQAVATPSGSSSYDSSPSIKWSVVGFNRPDVIEFIFPEVISGDYSNTILHYARIGP